MCVSVWARLCVGVSMDVRDGGCAYVYVWVCFSGCIYVWVCVCLCVGVCVWVSVGGGRWVTASQPQH